MAITLLVGSIICVVLANISLKLRLDDLQKEVETLKVQK